MGGRGKSSILYDVVARLTRGKLEAISNQPCNVVVATAEDVLAQVAVPRLVVAGADLERVSFAEYHSDGVAGIVNLPQDIDALIEACLRVDACLLVLDPIVAFLDGKIDAHRDQDVRRGPPVSCDSPRSAISRSPV